MCGILVEYIDVLPHQVVCTEAGKYLAQLLLALGKHPYYRRVDVGDIQITVADHQVGVGTVDG